MANFNLFPAPNMPGDSIVLAGSFIFKETRKEQQEFSFFSRLQTEAAEEPPVRGLWNVSVYFGWQLPLKKQVEDISRKASSNPSANPLFFTTAEQIVDEKKSVTSPLCCLFVSLQVPSDS